MIDLDLFTPRPENALEIQLGRPIGAWFETYCRIGDGRPARPDQFLLSEVRGFIDAVRSHAAAELGPGPCSDAAAALIGCAGLVARNMKDLGHALRQAHDWFGYYSPRVVRDGILAEQVEMRRAVQARRSTLRGRIMSMFDPRSYRVNVLALPGTRTFPYGGTIAVLRISPDGGMQFGIIIKTAICIVSEIGDDNGGWDDDVDLPRPTPTPELAL